MPEQPMTPDEKECALAALAALIEKAKGKKRRELQQQRRAIEAAPLLIGNAVVYQAIWSLPWTLKD
jgi:hypothetical protein